MSAPPPAIPKLRRELVPAENSNLLAIASAMRSSRALSQDAYRSSRCYLDMQISRIVGRQNSSAPKALGAD